MSEQSEALKRRTMTFAVNTLQGIKTLPPSPAGMTIARQLARSATSIGANYRAACNARSRAEFIARLGVVVEEADESIYWLDLAVNTHVNQRDQFTQLRQEAGELRAIFARSLGTARRNFQRNSK